MTNQQRIIQEVAEKLGITQKQVLGVVSSQTALVKKAMQNKEATSVYLRQVGTFMSYPVRGQIKAAKIKAKKDTRAAGQQPYKFDK